MDEFLDAVAQSLANAGPEYVTALGLVAIGAWVVAKALPLYASHQAMTIAGWVLAPVCSALVTYVITQRRIRSTRR